MAKLVEGKVALITGAAGGIGREHALMLASHGAKIVVNDLGGDMSGQGEDLTQAQKVVEEIQAMGGEAVVNGGNVASFTDAKAMIDQAIDTYGDLNILINNAGILRDRMLFSMSEDDWDSIMAVHLKGTFGPTHHAAVYWRNKAKAGEETYGRVINTSSPSGIYGNIGQSNYGAAKAGIAAFTVITAMELAKYNVTVNAVTQINNGSCRPSGATYAAYTRTHHVQTKMAATARWWEVGSRRQSSTIFEERDI